MSEKENTEFQEVLKKVNNIIYYVENMYDDTKKAAELEKKMQDYIRYKEYLAQSKAINMILSLIQTEFKELL